MSVEENLSASGYAVPTLAPPAGAYVPAVHAGGYVQTSGQLPLEDGELPERFVGKVGGAVDVDTAREAAARCAVNALAAVKAAIGDLDRVDRVVKVVGFVASDPSFTNQPEVLNAASQLLQDAFGEAGRHARSAVGVAALPRDVCVEVELLVQAR